MKNLLTESIHQNLSNSQITKFKNSGFKNPPIGYYKRKEAKEIKGFKLFIRKTPGFPLQSNCDNNHYLHSLSIGNETIETKPFNMNDITTYSSIQAIKGKHGMLTIAVHCEYNCVTDNYVNPISYHFFVYHEQDNTSYEFIMLPQSSNKLTLEMALAVILDHLNIQIPILSPTVYEYCDDIINGVPKVSITSSFAEAQQKAKYCYINGEVTNKEINHMRGTKCDYKCYVKSFDIPTENYIPIQLLCHQGTPELRCFDDFETFSNRCDTIHNGVTTPKPIKIHAKSRTKGRASNSWIYPINLNIRDTYCHVPKDYEKLSNLGELVGFPNYVDSEDKRNYSLYSTSRFRFLENASTASKICWMYASLLYGVNKLISVTINSAAASIAHDKIKHYLNVKTTSDYEQMYRGLCRRNKGFTETYPNGKPVTQYNYEPNSYDSGLLQEHARASYYGGYNSCTEIGFFSNELFFDYDLKNAYPTVMCLFLDIDWFANIEEYSNIELTLQHFLVNGKYNPMIPLFAYVQFEFPSDTKFPSIPIYVNGKPIRPLSSEGNDGVYASAPEIYLALKMGAKVKAKKVIIGKTLSNENGVSKSLAYVVKDLVTERNYAKATFGKGSLWDVLLKQMVNAIYGKIAQNVRDTSEWQTSANKNVEPKVNSPITNCVAASLITGFTRAVLIATQAQIEALGYKSVSVTTDGFISNCPEEELNKLDLFGFKEYLEEARLFLTDGKDSSIWEKKHFMSDLINGSTRLNNSLSLNGVNAHGGYMSNFLSDSDEERYAVRQLLLTRTGTEICSKESMVSLKAFNKDKNAPVYRTISRLVNFNFDLRRKPIFDSITSDHVLFDGLFYDIAHIQTVPYKTTKEYEQYIKPLKNIKVLKTIDDFKAYSKMVKHPYSKATEEDKEYSKLRSCLLYYKKGNISIPALSKDKTSLEEKIAYFEKLNNHPTKHFTKAIWKSLKDENRIKSAVPLEDCREMIERNRWIIVKNE